MTKRERERESALKPVAAHSAGLSAFHGAAALAAVLFGIRQFYF